MTTTIRVRSREVLTAVQWMQHGDHENIWEWSQTFPSICPACQRSNLEHGLAEDDWDDVQKVCPSSYVVLNQNNAYVAAFKTRADLEAAYETVNEETT